jgi:hypothetical protein
MKCTDGHRLPCDGVAGAHPAEVTGAHPAEVTGAHPAEARDLAGPPPAHPTGGRRPAGPEQA